MSNITRRIFVLPFILCALFAISAFAGPTPVPYTTATGCSTSAPFSCWIVDASLKAVPQATKLCPSFIKGGTVSADGATCTFPSLCPSGSTAMDDGASCRKPPATVPVCPSGYRANSATTCEGCAKGSVLSMGTLGTSRVITTVCGSGTPAASTGMYPNRTAPLTAPVTPTLTCWSYVFSADKSYCSGVPKYCGVGVDRVLSADKKTCSMATVTQLSPCPTGTVLSGQTACVACPNQAWQMTNGTAPHGKVCIVSAAACAKYVGKIDATSPQICVLP